MNTAPAEPVGLDPAAANRLLAARKLEAMDLLMQQAREAIAKGDRREARIALTAVLRCPEFKDPTPKRPQEKPASKNAPRPPLVFTNGWEDIWAGDNTYKYPGIYCPEMYEHAKAAGTLPPPRKPGDPYVIPTPAPAPIPRDNTGAALVWMITRGVPSKVRVDLGPHAVYVAHPQSPSG